MQRTNVYVKPGIRRIVAMTDRATSVRNNLPCNALTLLLGAFLALTLANPALAEQATPNQMENVGANWLVQSVARFGSWAGSTAPKIRETGEIEQNGILLARYYNVEPDGFIVVPVLMEMSPVKMYSENGYFDAAETDGLIQLLRDLLYLRYTSFADTYGSIDAVQSGGSLASYAPEHREQWDRLAVSSRDFRPSQTLSVESAGPLLTSSWFQGSPYNNDCPVGQSGNTVVGCVATATAQILNFWQYPGAGFGSYSYLWSGDNSCGGMTTPPQQLTVDLSDPFDWADMRDSCDDGVGCNTAQQAALAELNYEVAVAYRMDFGSCGSGSSATLGFFQLPFHFRYDWSITGVGRKDYDLEGWFGIIQSEIDAGRPIQYGILSHSIVCDGWREGGITHEFHMNYGWGQSNNAWYMLDNLACNWAAGGICPFEVENMVIHIEPETATHMTYDGCFLAEASGDADGHPDPGETIDLMPVVRNLGLDVTNATVSLSTVDSYVSLSGSPSALKPTLTRGQWDTAATPLVVEIDAGCPDPHVVDLTLHLTEDGGFAADYPVRIFVGDTRGLEDDVESGEGAWLHRAITERYIDQWHTETNRSHSGATSWKAGGPGAVGYADGSDGGLISRPIVLAPGSELRFWHYMAAESGGQYAAWDGGIVMLSENGVDWTRLTPTEGYPQNTYSTGSMLPFDGLSGLYSGQQNWAEAIFDLSAYSGSVQVMFRFGSDGGATDEGWYVDDIWVGNTPAGFDIEVSPAEGLTLILGTVSAPGSTVAGISEDGPVLPSLYAPMPIGAPRFYDVTTSAIVTGIVQVEMSYEESELQGSEADLRLLAYIDGSWQDKTLMVDQTGNKVTGLTFSLCPLVLVEPTSCCFGRVGDANGVGGDEPTIGDVSAIIDAKFISGTCDGLIECLTEADINQSGGVDPVCDDVTIGDISTLIDYLFITGSSLGLPDCL